MIGKQCWEVCLSRISRGEAIRQMPRLIQLNVSARRAAAELPESGSSSRMKVWELSAKSHH